MKLDLMNLLASNEYPGRGIVIGKNAENTHAVITYFIMGRSENSRNRVFVETDDGIITKAFDESKMVDPSLIIYAPVHSLEQNGKQITVVTNGDQTDTVFNALQVGGTFEGALRTRTFEPDAPNFTPRISGIVTLENGKAAYKLSILKSDDGDENSVQRFFYEYDQPKAGEGHFIHTYRCNGNPRIPSFEGEPETVAIEGDQETYTWKVWNSLNENNKVSLYTCWIDLETGDKETMIINRNEN